MGLGRVYTIIPDFVCNNTQEFLNIYSKYLSQVDNKEYNLTIKNAILSKNELLYRIPEFARYVDSQLIANGQEPENQNLYDYDKRKINRVRRFITFCVFTKYYIYVFLVLAFLVLGLYNMYENSLLHYTARYLSSYLSGTIIFLLALLIIFNPLTVGILLVCFSRASIKFQTLYHYAHELDATTSLNCENEM